jgi:hypothetical protein
MGPGGGAVVAAVVDVAVEDGVRPLKPVGPPRASEAREEDETEGVIPPPEAVGAKT